MFKLNKLMSSVFMLLLMSINMAWSAPAQATSSNSPKFYKIELIVFKYKDNLPSVDKWQNYQPNDVYQNSMMLQETSQNNQPIMTYQLLPSQDYSLMKDEQRIARAKGYHVLVHMAWIQPINSKTGKTKIRIMGGQSYQDTTSNSVIPELDGTIQLSQNAYKYINIKTHLTLTEPMDNNLMSYSLQQSRRLKLKQLNYLDNPALGILIEVMPYQQNQQS